ATAPVRTGPMPRGMNPPWAVRFAKPAPEAGHAPRMYATPTHRNTMMAATLMEANQYSTSPQDRTENRFNTENDSTRASVSIHGAPPGTASTSAGAPATASSATTMTQKYQYIQPVRNPASSPSARRLYS